MSQVRDHRDAGEPPKRRRGGDGFVLFLFIAFGGLAGYFFHSIPNESPRTVWLVNGTNEPYDVLIDGVRYDVAEGTPGTMTLRPGTYTMRVIQPETDLPLTDEVVATRKAFFEEHVPAATEVSFTLAPKPRILVFGSDFNALNPDGTAMLRFSDVVYDDSSGSPHELRPPALHHVFKGVDDVFENSPGFIEKSYFGSAVRRRVDSVLYEDRLLIPGMAGEPLGEAETKAIIMARFAMAPDRYYWTSEARRAFGEDSAADVLTAMRADVPHESIIPEVPKIVIPPPHPASMLNPRTAVAEGVEDVAWNAELSAAISDELLTQAIGTDPTRRRGGQDRKPLIDAIRPFRKDNKAAEQITYLLNNLVTYSPDRAQKLVVAGVPDRVRFALLLSLQRRERYQLFAEYNDIARALGEELAANDIAVPDSWMAVLGDPLRGWEDFDVSLFTAATPAAAEELDREAFDALQKQLSRLRNERDIPEAAVVRDLTRDPGPDPADLIALRQTDTPDAVIAALGRFLARRADDPETASQLLEAAGVDP